jgi:hypothetical protein
MTVRSYTGPMSTRLRGGVPAEIWGGVYLAFLIFRYCIDPPARVRVRVPARVRVRVPARALYEISLAYAIPLPYLNTNLTHVLIRP